VARVLRRADLVVGVKDVTAELSDYGSGLRAGIGHPIARRLLRDEQVCFYDATVRTPPHTKAAYMSAQHITSKFARLNRLGWICVYSIKHLNGTER
jgi:hypothetical protein